MELELLLDMKGTSRRRSRRRRHSRLTEGLLPGPPTAGTPAPEDKAVTSQPERTASPSSPAAIVTGNPTDDVMTSGLDGVILEAVNQLPGPTAN